MRFLSIYRPSKKNPGPPSKEHLAKMQVFMDHAIKAGELVMTGGLMPGRTYVRAEEGEIRVTDGPFAEAKELVAGFAVLEAKSKADAIEMSKRFLAVCGDGECELHEMMGEPPRPA